jgi:hypothetical protein
MTALTEGDITGLIADLQVRAVKAPGFSNSRAAIINDTGGIEGAVGNPLDCVRVDGTSASCGILFVDFEIPAGTANGSNAVFTIVGVPSPAASLKVFRNGLLQSPGADYTQNGSIITFVTLAIPQPGDILTTSYRQ